MVRHSRGSGHGLAYQEGGKSHTSAVGSDRQCVCDQRDAQDQLEREVMAPRLVFGPGVDPELFFSPQTVEVFV